MEHRVADDDGPQPVTIAFALLTGWGTNRTTISPSSPGRVVAHAVLSSLRVDIPSPATKACVRSERARRSADRAAKITRGTSAIKGFPYLRRLGGAAKLAIVMLGSLWNTMTNHSLVSSSEGRIVTTFGLVAPRPRCGSGRELGNAGMPGGDCRELTTRPFRLCHERNISKGVPRGVP